MPAVDRFPFAPLSHARLSSESPPPPLPPSLLLDDTDTDTFDNTHDGHLLTSPIGRPAILPPTAATGQLLLLDAERGVSPADADLSGGVRYETTHVPVTTGLVSFVRTSRTGTHASDSSQMSVNPAREAEGNLRNHSLSLSRTGSAVVGAEVSSLERADGTIDLEGSRGIDTAAAVEQHSRAVHVMANMDGALPANDGMRDLRRKLQEIRELAVSTEEKAQRMHFLMTEDYNATRQSAASPASINNGVPFTLPPDEPGALDVGLAAMPIDASNPYSVHDDDLIPSYSPLPPNPSHGYNDVDEGIDEDDDLPPLGCMHYKRNVKIQCFDCRRWFPCRHCHDAASDLPFEHNLRRKLTRNMLCMLCQTPQPAAEMCANCGEYAAWYYCHKCKLWDNDSNKRIYHCDDCGICRVGEGLGKDFVHCKRCNVCISISTSADHPCIERATEGDCPLCLAQLFESKTAVVSLPCGHYMHGDCYKDLMAVTYKCPVCSKSAVNMELQWRKLDDEIRVQPMPEDDEELEGLLPHIEVSDEDNDGTRSPAPRQRRPRTVYIGCNDCGAHSWSPFHWLGLKCQVCDSYNTNQMAPTAVRETEAERLLRQQQQQVHRQHDFTGNAVLRDAGIGAEDAALRVDSAFEIPSSPSHLPVPNSPTSPTTPQSPRSPASGAQSPRGRYFVQPEEPRRPSFTTSRFSAPNLPTLPEMPRLPRMPNLPNLPNIPNLPQMQMPNLPNMPNLPDFPRFSPYDVFDSLSRSLSPMRYYLQGLDARDSYPSSSAAVAAAVAESARLRRDRERRARSPMSVRSDPTMHRSTSRTGMAGDDEDEGFESEGAAGIWRDDERGDADGYSLSEDEHAKARYMRRRVAGTDGHDGFPRVEHERDDDDDDEEEDDESDMESESETSDAELVDDDDEGEDAGELDLLGHR